MLAKDQNNPALRKIEAPCIDPFHSVSVKCVDRLAEFLRQSIAKIAKLALCKTRKNAWIEHTGARIHPALFDQEQSPLLER